jgi:hypothetical protein
LELNRIYQLPDHIDINLLGENIIIINKNTEVLLDACKDVVRSKGRNKFVNVAKLRFVFRKKVRAD